MLSSTKLALAAIVFTASSAGVVANPAPEPTPGPAPLDVEYAGVQARQASDSIDSIISGVVQTATSIAGDVTSFVGSVVDGPLSTINSAQTAASSAASSASVSAASVASSVIAGVSSDINNPSPTGAANSINSFGAQTPLAVGLASVLMSVGLGALAVAV